MSFKFEGKILFCEPGVLAQSEYRFTGTEFFFRDHFENYPVLPGVIQVELLAQLATHCLRSKDAKIFPVLLSIRSANFYRMIKPTDVCLLKIQKESEVLQAFEFSGSIYVGEELACQVRFIVKNGNQDDFVRAYVEANTGGV